MTSASSSSNSSAQSVMVNIVCPLLGVIICNFMWLSPMRAILKARRRRDLESLNPYPFAAMIVNCIGWIIYSCLRKDFFMFFGNIFGLVWGLFYSIQMLTLLAKKNKSDEFSDEYLHLERLLLFAFLFWGLMGFLAGTLFNNFPDPIQQACELIGKVSCAFSIAYYAAPLSTIFEVIATKDSSSMLFPLIVINLINAILWFSYGLGLFDINIWGPNGLGIILAIIQINVVFLYKKASFHDVILGRTDSVKLKPNKVGEIDRFSKDTKAELTAGENEEDTEFQEINLNDEPEASRSSKAVKSVRWK